jgi:hypothetical protein
MAAIVCFLITKLYKMSTTQSNRVSVTLTDQQLSDVRTAFKTITGLMPFLTGLTPEERQAIPKINDSNKTFTEDAIVSAVNNADLLPGYFSSAEMQNDLTLYKQLDEFSLLASQLSEKIDDTRMIAGSEAYINALTMYRLMEAASKAGVPGSDAVYDLLKQRFAGQGGSGPAPVVTPTP